MKRIVAAITAILALVLVPSLGRAGEKTKEFTLHLTDESRLVLIKGAIRAPMADEIVQQIYELDQESSLPIYYLINSNGGSLMAGNQIIRAMTSAKSPSICIVDRAAFSMGALILTHCNTAYVYKDSAVMFHEGYLGIEGRVSEVVSFIDFEKKEFDKLTADTAKLLKMTVADFAAKQKDEWWLTADDVLKIGLAKAIVTKLTYPVPREEKLMPLPFGLFEPNEDVMTKEDGVFDLTYYPPGNNPYAPFKSGRTN